MTNIFEEFQWRGLIHSFTEGTPEVLATEKVTVYIGFDPSADSLQIGNLLTLMGLARMQRFGHSPIALAGGGTGMIGDPSGKASERPLLSRAQVEANVEAIKPQLERFLDFEVKSNPARIVNNADWLCQISLMDFLRDVGKHFSVNFMVAKDAVKTRLEREEGISYTEFSYMLLQSYDFVQLYDRYGCTMQAGGSDQWGNIVAGVELMRRMRNARGYGLVYPLLTNADGSKLGKSVHGTIFLDAKHTSPYRFYQYWFNRDDADVIDDLKHFTWMTQDEIAAMAHKVATQPELREAQRTLARTMTAMVHGETALARAEQASQALFGGELAGLSAAELSDIFSEAPSSQVARAALEGAGKPLVDMLVDAGLTKSKGEARRLIDNGGVYVNNVQAASVDQAVTLADAIEGQFVVLRKGKKSYHLVQVRG
ncbi:MAG TPA: tyrosine--tRNA ligase [Anaerolineae bacterium]|mgnify:CR=1 FL=1|nr:tyrosine--tRNA ligase [Anaerolineae bacterium]HQH39222.1 tyrosine--tRNA ligase [Anaerolineae bacterium]